MIRLFQVDHHVADTFDCATTGRLNPSAMITSKIRLEDVEEKGFKALIEGRDQHVKILVDIAA